MCLLLRDKLTTKPPHWKLNESISDAGEQSESCSLRPHTQAVHRRSTQPVASGTTATPPQRPGSGLSAGREESGLRPPWPPIPTCWFTPGSASISIAWTEAAAKTCSFYPWKILVEKNSVQVKEELPSGLSIRLKSDPRPKRPSAPSQPSQRGNNKEIYKFWVNLTVKLRLWLQEWQQNATFIPLNYFEMFQNWISTMKLFDIWHVFPSAACNVNRQTPHVK